MRLLHTAAPVVKEVVRQAWSAQGQPPEDAIEPSEHVRELMGAGMFSRPRRARR
ncbi:hypothetical protein [Pseudomonas tohonis]|uniref:hypothetical protein n=1 Tax=Pseudomonas tohonis TaxID=2725477 RepID=UPI00255BAC7D|nr:hypothetical protein [Pseudomonas tohonis]